MITIGITAIGGGVGQNVLASLRASNLRARVVGFDASPWGVGVHECDVAYRLPLPNDPAYVPTLLSRCREEKVALLIPGSDSELPILARCAPDLEAIGCRVLVSGPECVRICRDKLATYRELAPLGAPIVETWAPEEAEPHARDLPYPLVAKPRSGSGSRGVVILMRPDDWACLPRHESYVVQPYLFPADWEADPAKMSAALERLDRTRQPIQEDAMVIQAMTDERGELLGVYMAMVNHKSGIPTVNRPIEHPELRDACRGAVGALALLGLRGPVNLCGYWTRRGMLLFEINARFTGSTYPRALLGYNEVEAAVRYFALGQDRETVRRTLRPRVGWAALRQVHGYDIAVPLDKMATFEAEGCLVSVSAPRESKSKRRRARRRGRLAPGRATDKV